MRLPFAVLLPALLCSGCRDDALAPQPEPETPADTTATPLRFEDYFAELAIEDAGTGQRGIYDVEQGYRFSRKARLQLAYVAHQASPLRVVVESRTTGEAAGVWNTGITAGSGILSLGTFPGDLYLLHVYISTHPRLASIPFAAE